MINSRAINDLVPAVASRCHAFTAACHLAGVDVLITSTYRDNESQDALYAQGRTTPGKKVTDRKGGQSIHNYMRAFDFVPLRNGKPVWGNRGEDGKLWEKCGIIGEACGLSWSGRWKGRSAEMAHMQYLGGMTLEMLQADKGEVRK